MQVFYLAMTRYPEVQRKAQAELDAVVGSSRLPNFDDRPSLVYIEALLRECLRWQLVIPLVPHKTSEDDIYNGYFIPKGSLIFANSWYVSFLVEVGYSFLLAYAYFCSKGDHA